MDADKKLGRSEAMVSPNKTCLLVNQNNGDIVVYRIDGPQKLGIVHSGTSGQPTCTVMPAEKEGCLFYFLLLQSGGLLKI